MTSRTRRAALIAAVALSAVVAGCGGAQQPAAPAPTSETAPPSAAETSEAPDESGLTKTSDIFGPACSQVPASGPGSAQAMVSQPVGSAAASNPLLTTLVKAVQQAGLVDTLNDTSKQYTVFAPANSAFQQLPPGALDQLLKDRAKLTQTLTYHVVPQRFSAQQLADGNPVTTVQGANLSFEGDAQTLTVGDQQARVLCGNIPTKNATVFVIDKILTPPAS